MENFLEVNIVHILDVVTENFLDGYLEASFYFVIENLLDFDLENSWTFSWRTSWTFTYRGLEHSYGRLLKGFLIHSHGEPSRIVRRGLLGSLMEISPIVSRTPFCRIYLRLSVLVL